jgi:CubicO group peptidase (beta-lactamase class C family)
MRPGLTAALNGLLAEHISQDSPGCVLGVVADARLKAIAARGLANVEHRKPITWDTVFHIASTSKQFAAYSCALLAERGQLDPDAPVSTVLDDFPFHNVTTRHLIHHVSGIRDQWALLILSSRSLEDVITTDEIARLVARQRELNFEPGSALVYSNTGYTLLGLIVERVTGISLRQFMAKEIFEPLGMTKTVLLEDHREVIRNRADSYVKSTNEDGFRRIALSYSTCGATSLNTTVSDLGRWAVHAMTPKVRGRLERRITLNDGTPIAYATGVIAGTHKGYAVLEHAGGDAGYRTHFVMFPNEGVAAIALSNLASCPVVELAYAAADLAIGTRTKAPVPSWQPSVDEVAFFEGLYYDPLFGETYELVAQGTAVRLGADVLEPSTPGTFRSPVGGLELQMRPDVLLRAKAISERVLERVEWWSPSPEDLASFTGHYWSDELETRWTIGYSEQRLTLETLRWGACVLKPTVRDAFIVSLPTFVAGETTISLQFGKTRAVLLVSLSRASRVRFRRMSCE